MPGFDPITSIFNFGTSLIDRIIPDKTAAAQAKAQLLSSEVQGQIQEIIGQIEVDKAEAASNITFVAGWRPGVGWACAAAFAYSYVVQPFLVFLLLAFNHKPLDLPQLDMNQMMPVLLGMLGLGALRSYDKNNGKDNGA